jgi:phage terminase Nu1 subunit (DNA packaging protein)
MGMYGKHSLIMGSQARLAEQSCQLCERRGRIRNKRKKTTETLRELMALISYLRQQEAAVLDAMQRLRDAN